MYLRTSENEETHTKKAILLIVKVLAKITTFLCKIIVTPSRHQIEHRKVTPANIRWLRKENPFNTINDRSYFQNFFDVKDHENGGETLKEVQTFSSLEKRSSILKRRESCDFSRRVRFNQKVKVLTYVVTKPMAPTPNPRRMSL